MKLKKIVLVVTMALLCSCATTKITEDDKLKNKLIGSWSGSEEDNQHRGLTKYWIQIRNSNGSFTLLFTSIENCEVDSHIEKGKWWIKDGLFYETFGKEKTPDVYKVELLENGDLKFIAKKLSSEFDNKEYEFFETRQE